MTFISSKWLPASFRLRLLLAFSLSFTVSLLLVLQAMSLSHYLSELRDVREQLILTRLSTSEMLQSDKDFVNDNYLNLAYYRTGESPYLEDREVSFAKLEWEVFTLQELLQSYDLGDFDLRYIKHVLADYDKTFMELTEKQRIRGFKDYGLEGKMRRFAHQLESNPGNIPIVELLMLRRHEKDFFLRYDEQYVYKLRELAKRLIEENRALEDSSLPNEAKLIENYLTAFMGIVKLDEEIGRNDSQGYRAKLKQNNAIITESLADVFRRVSHLTEVRRSATINHILVLLVIAVLLNLGIGILLSRTVTRPIEKLAKRMQKPRSSSAEPLTINDFRKEDLSREMRILITSYVRMVSASKLQLDEINNQKLRLEEQNQHLLSLNEELDKFSYSVSHDLRSPLTSIMGLVRLAQHENPQYFELLYLHHISDCVERLDGFVQNLLHYTRNKNLDPKLEHVDIQELVEEVKKTYILHLQQDVLISVETEGAKTFLTDRYRILTVLQNLISNSIRYRHPERAIVHINILCSARFDGTTIEVTDNGKGISKDNQQKVFEMFYKDKDSTNGSGLGLYIVQKIITRLNGRITLESIEDKGTTFRVTIPNDTNEMSDRLFLELTEHRYVMNRKKTPASAIR